VAHATDSRAARARSAVSERIHIHRLSARLWVVDPNQVSMSDAVALMTGAIAPPSETRH
jgi:hypothetical protein